MFPTQMFPRLPPRATFVADTNFVSGTPKMLLILFRNIFPRLRSPRNIMSNNVSATMCPRLPVPLSLQYSKPLFFAHTNATLDLFYYTYGVAIKMFYKDAVPPPPPRRVNFCWVCAAGLSEPLPHYSLFRGQLLTPT